jgi:hypothetical protein
MYYEEAEPWQVGFHVFVALNEGGMVVRVQFPNRDNPDEYIIIPIWIPFGSALLVRADLYVSTCQQWPNSLSLQGWLVPSTDYLGWDGVDTDYLPESSPEGDHYLPEFKNLPAWKLIGESMEHCNAHHLHGTNSYWHLHSRNLTGTMANAAINQLQKQERSFPEMPADFDYFPHKYADGKKHSWKPFGTIQLAGHVRKKKRSKSRTRKSNNA